ncbi:MAG: hypothetical protein IT236_17765 [Bacteroidia bacterium]|nr:hypothetical protein [Bacteroidia bacterium]
MLQGKTYWFLIAVGICLLPLFFINKTDTADWGDDYVQYIYQSKHLFNTSDYKTVVNHIHHAPVKRGVFFSLLLSANHSGAIINYKNLVCLTYVLTGLLVFLFFTKHFTDWQSFFLSLCVVYNYRCIGLKNEIVAEFLFMAILYGIFYLSTFKTRTAFYVIALLFACLIHVRLVGLVFYLAYLIGFVLNNSFSYSPFTKLKLLASQALGALALVFVMHWLLMPSLSNVEFSFYKHTLKEFLTIQSFTDNFQFYFRNLGYFFEQELPNAINIFIKLLALAGIVFGVMTNLRREQAFVLLSLFFYLLTLLVRPDQSAATRYLIPVLPLLFYFFLKGLMTLLKGEQAFLKYRLQVINGILIIVFVSNFNTLFLIKNPDKPLGPFSAELKPDFDAIQKYTQTNDQIAFTKPLVINLMCNRNSFALKHETNAEALASELYFLIPRNPALNEVYQLTRQLKGPVGDTLVLEYFYLIKNRPVR